MVRARYKQIDRTKAPPDDVVIEYDVDIIGSAGEGVVLCMRVRDQQILELATKFLKGVA